MRMFPWLVVDAIEDLKGCHFGGRNVKRDGQEEIGGYIHVHVLKALDLHPMRLRIARHFGYPKCRSCVLLGPLHLVIR